MNILHIELVKEAIGSQSIQALRKIFEDRRGTPPAVPIRRFRADHEQWIDILDSLERTHSLIERSQDHENYLVRPYALPLVGTDESNEILNKMGEIYSKFPELYKEHLSSSIGLDIICNNIRGDEKVIQEALYYISETHGVYSTITTGFPYTENSVLGLSESVLSKKSIDQVLSEYYEWHFVNPKNQISYFEEFSLAHVEHKSAFFSGTSYSKKPDWYEFLDDTQKALILEIDDALQQNLTALPTIGLRTLLETIMVEKISDEGGFAKKVKRFTDEGYVTPKMSEALSHVLDAGNASAHRAYFPSQEDLMACVELVKHLIHGIYILRPNMEKVAGNTPKRTN